jgi:colanic acid/amylovoran biosynthesis glycosyltransferase
MSRIAFGHYGARADVSGVTTWLLGLVSVLAGGGDEVGVFLHHFASVGDKSCGESSFAKELGQIGVTISGILGPAYTEKSVMEAIRFLNEFRPACFAPQCLPDLHFAADFAARHGLPWIFTVHSDDPSYWAIAEECGPVPSNGVWVAVSKYLASEILKRFPFADVRTIPYGVQVPKSPTKWHPERFRVVYSGRLVEQQKRISLVMKSLMLACHSHPAVDVVILGEGSSREAVEQAVVDAGLSDRILFKGRLTSDEVQLELLQAQAILLMSDYEGLPVALLEGMATGLVPIVRQISSGIPELVLHGETGILVGDDPESAATAIATLASDKDNWEKISAASRSFVSDRYSFDYSRSLWKSLLTELSVRSNVIYPIPSGAKICLPPLREALRGLDNRAPARPVRWYRRGVTKILLGWQQLQQMGQRTFWTLCRRWLR